MNFGYLFTSFEGRINRQPFWLGWLAFVVVMIVLWLVASLFVTGIMTPGSTGQTITQIVFLLIGIYPMSALMVKRLHDRNRPGILVAVFYAPSVLNIIGQALGITGEMTDVGGTMMLLPNTLGWILTVATLVVGIWALVELGFLRGTKGPNQYGPDPLEER